MLVVRAIEKTLKKNFQVGRRRRAIPWDCGLGHPCRLFLISSHDLSCIRHLILVRRVFSITFFVFISFQQQFIRFSATVLPFTFIAGKSSLLLSAQICSCLEFVFVVLPFHFIYYWKRSDSFQFCVREVDPNFLPIISTDWVESLLFFFIWLIFSKFKVLQKSNSF